MKLLTNNEYDDKLLTNNEYDDKLFTNNEYMMTNISLTMNI